MPSRTSKSKKTALPPPADPRSAVIDAALDLAAEKGWLALSLAEIAQRAGLDLAALRGLVSSKEAILGALNDRIDDQVLAGLDPADSELPIRDRLFDLLMRRFEALEPWKPGLVRLTHELPRDPMLLLLAGLRVERSMCWTLEAAGLSASGILGRLRAKVLLGVYLAGLKTWLTDDSPDLSKTLAALDKAIGQVEGLAGFCRILKNFPCRKRAYAAPQQSV